MGEVSSTLPSPSKSHSIWSRPALAFASAENVKILTGVPSFPVSENGDHWFIEADGSVTAKTATGFAIVVKVEAARMANITANAGVIFLFTPLYTRYGYYIYYLNVCLNLFLNLGVNLKLVPYKRDIEY
ncbi:hypothetical protein [Candidatus Nitrososphaera sp. FF02]|uniref:hypothetical protein n=1 Tax=Candidatus Nitrososphaera sp. FF02 TaxID=3398226 RepID=UPI0039EBD429